jgi:hypothetical protein
MRRRILTVIACVAASAGCAVIKSTDVTDASYKRYKSIAVLGWPIYTRVTDGDRTYSAPSRLAIKEDGANRAHEVESAELLEPRLDEPAPLVHER